MKVKTVMPRIISGVQGRKVYMSIVFVHGCVYVRVCKCVCNLFIGFKGYAKSANKNSNYILQGPTNLGPGRIL